MGGIFTAVVQIISLATGESSVKSAFFYFMIGNAVLVVTLALYVVLSRSVYFQFHLTQQLDNTVTIQTEVSSEGIDYLKILNRIWIYGISEWLVFVITLSIYPGVTVLVESQNKGMGNKWSGNIKNIHLASSSLIFIFISFSRFIFCARGELSYF